MIVYLPGKIIKRTSSSGGRPDVDDSPNTDYINVYVLDEKSSGNKYRIEDKYNLYRHKYDIITDLQATIEEQKKKIETLSICSPSGGSKYNRTRKNMSRKSAHKNLRKSKYHRK